MKHLLFYKTTFENQKGAFSFELISVVRQEVRVMGGVTMYIYIYTQILTLLNLHDPLYMHKYLHKHIIYVYIYVHTYSHTHTYIYRGTAW